MIDVQSSSGKNEKAERSPHETTRGIVQPGEKPGSTSFSDYHSLIMYALE